MDKGSPPKEWCLDFENWLEGLLASEPGSQRDSELCGFEKAPGADMAHPHKQPWPAHRGLSKDFSSPGEHLMPWYFAYGAAGENATGQCVFKEYLGSLPMAAYTFRPP